MSVRAQPLAQVDEDGLSVSAPVVFDVTDSLVEGEVLAHPFVGVEMDGVESGGASLRLGELQERPAGPGALVRRIDRDVVDVEAFLVDARDDQPDDLAAA